MSTTKKRKPRRKCYTIMVVGPNGSTRLDIPVDKWDRAKHEGPFLRAHSALVDAFLSGKPRVSA